MQLVRSLLARLVLFGGETLNKKMEGATVYARLSAHALRIRLLFKSWKHDTRANGNHFALIKKKEDIL